MDGSSGRAWKTRRRVPFWTVLWTALATCVALAAPARALAASPPARAPLLVIPGILGSRLVDTRTHQLVWGGDLRHLAELGQLEYPLPPVRDTIEPDGLIERVTVFGPLKTARGGYGKLRSFLLGLGYVEGKDLFFFAYDWRESNFDTARALDEYVASVPALRSGRFSLLAHSMGGLVAAIFVAEGRFGSQVDRVITLGTPFFGSAEALRLLSQGFESSAANWLAGSAETVRTVAASLPSVYELLPSYRGAFILGAASDPARQAVDLLAPAQWLRFPWLQARFRADPARAFLAQCLARRARLEAVVRRSGAAGRPPTRRVAGRRVDTPFRTYADRSTGLPLSWIDEEGDGTVSAHSAAAGEPASAIVALEKHASLFWDDHVQTAVKDLLVIDSPRRLLAYAGPAVGKIVSQGHPVEIGAVSLRLQSSYALVGQPFVLEVAVADTGGRPIEDLPVPRLLWAREGQEGQDLPLERLAASRFRAVIPRVKDAGSHVVTLILEGVGTIDDSFLALAPEEPGKPAQRGENGGNPPMR